MRNALKDRLEHLAERSRPVGAIALLDRVERQLAGEPTTGLVARRPSRPWFAYAAALVTVLVLGSVTWIGLTRPTDPAPPFGSDPIDRWGLATVDLPDTVEEVVAVFESMPADLAGIPLTGDPTGGHLVEYGEGGPSLSYQTASEHLRLPDGTISTPAEWLELMSGASEFDVIGYVVDEPVVWLYASYAAADGSPDAGQILEVGDANGEFLFGFGAPTGEGLDAIVAAFIDTAERLAVGEVATTTSAPDETVTTLPEPIEIPARVDDPAWIDFSFTSAVDVEGSGEWVEDPDKLIDVGAFVVRLVVNGEVTDVWPWHVGGDIALGGRPGIEIVVVGPEPNPYTPGEYAQEVEGVVPPGPDPDATHELAVWAVEEIGPGAYVITDVAPLVRSGENMGYGALVEVAREYDLCSVQAVVEGNLYAYLDHADPEMEVFYPATLVFTVTADGRVETVDPSLVSCILAPDWETRGY
jgi:hypothetical protein